LAVGQWTNG